MEIKIKENLKNGKIDSRITKRNLSPVYENFVNKNASIINSAITVMLSKLNFIVENHLNPLLDKYDSENEEDKKKYKETKQLSSLTNSVITQYSILGKLNSDIAIAENNTLTNFVNKVSNGELADSIEPEYLRAVNAEEESFRQKAVNTIDEEMLELAPKIFK